MTPADTPAPSRTLTGFDPAKQGFDDVRLAVADLYAAVVPLCAGDADLPQVDIDGVRAAEAALRASRYKVLVCGEAKRGKSTFINALLGKPLLPTDTDIATAQVFEIKHAATESLQVRFEDDSTKAIGADDLPRYGSQVAQEGTGFLRPDGIVRQIEVALPAPYLPPDIVLYDTPGLGSLYSGHAKITYRYVPQADAVIFVLDSNAPISKPEQAFLSEILLVTPHVFFLQTRIDQVRQADWEKVLGRNRDILATLVPDPQIYPVSSVLMGHAAKLGRPELLQTSRFVPMLAGLRRFLFHATGIAKTRRYARQLSELHAEVKPVLEERLQTVMARLRGEKETFLKKQSEAADTLRDTWAPGSRGRRTVEEKLRDTIEDARADFMSAIAPRSSIETALQGQIEALTDIKEAEPLATRITHDAVERIRHRWTQVTDRAVADVTDLVRPLCGSFRCDTALLEPLLESEGIENSLSRADGTVVKVRDTTLSRVRATWQESGVLMGIGGAVGVLTGGALMLPVALFTLATAGIGILSAGEKLAEQAKPQLSQHLQRVLGDIRLFYTETDAGAGRTNRVAAFFRELDRAARRAMDDEYERLLAQSKAETETLRKMATGSEAEATAALGATRKLLAGWDEWARRIPACLSALDRLQAMPLSAPAVVLPNLTAIRATEATVEAPHGATAFAVPTDEAAQHQFREIVEIAASDGVLSPKEGEMLRAKATALRLPPDQADKIVREVFATARAATARQGAVPTPAAPQAAPLTPAAFDAALRRAVAQSVASGVPVPDDVQTNLDAMADALRLSRAAVRAKETALRAELAGSAKSAEPSPANKYAAQFAASLARGNGTLTDADAATLDTLAETLGLSRADTRRIERETRAA